MHGRFICRNDKVKLHGAEAEPARFVQTMFAHGATDAETPRASCDDEARIRNMRAQTWPIRSQEITADNFPILLGHAGLRVLSKPVDQRFFARSARIKHIRVPSRDDLMKNTPDRFAVRIGG